MHRVNVQLQDNYCRWCGATTNRSVMEARGFDSQKEVFSLVQCESCGLVRTDPFLSGEELSGYYSQDYYGDTSAKFTPLIEDLIVLFNRVRDRVLTKRLPSNVRKRLLDVGSGRGCFLKAMSSYGFECYGLERSDFKQDANLPYELFCGEIQDLPMPSGYFDAVTFWHVFEHLEDPRSVLEYAFKLLKPGGFMVLAVPDFSSWQSKWFGRHWFHLDLPRHLHHFTAQWLSDQLSKAGKVVEVKSLATIEQRLYGFVQSTQNRFLSWILPANKLYSLMKRRAGVKDNVQFLLLMAFAALLFPFACVEYVLSSVMNKNAVVVIVIEKNRETDKDII